MVTPADRIRERLAELVSFTGMFKVAPVELQIVSHAMREPVQVAWVMRIRDVHNDERPFSTNHAFVVQSDCTDEELIRALYECAKRCVVHELAEGVLFKGKALYNSHNGETEAHIGLGRCVECRAPVRPPLTDVCADCAAKP